MNHALAEVERNLKTATVRYKLGIIKRYKRLVLKK